MVDLALVILNYNTRDLLRECLKSVYANTGLAFDVCVVDNASTDGSLEMVRAEFPQVHAVASPHNGGFSFGNNLGLRHYGFDGSRPAEERPRYAALLNPDTIVPEGALAGLVRFMDEHPDAGVCGPRLVLLDGQLDLACRRAFPTPEVAFYRLSGLSQLFPRSPRFGRYNMTYLDEHETAEVDSVVGACMVVRREAIRQAGLMDETFFMYGEDIDWAKRIKECGWKVYYYPGVIIHHMKRASSRHSRKAQVEFYRSMAIFYRKHYQADTPLLLHWLILTGIFLKGGLALGQDVLRRPPVPGAPGTPPGGGGRS